MISGSAKSNNQRVFTETMFRPAPFVTLLFSSAMSGKDMSKLIEKGSLGHTYSVAVQNG